MRTALLSLLSVVPLAGCLPASGSHVFVDAGRLASGGQDAGIDAGLEGGDAGVDGGQGAGDDAGSSCFEVSPSALNFGSTQAGSTATLAFSLTNTSAASLEITSLAVASPSPDSFAVLSPPAAPVIVDAGEAFIGTIRFFAPTRGTYLGQTNLSVVCAPDAGPTPVVIPMTAFVPAPCLRVDPAAPTLTFNEGAQRCTSPKQSVTLYNSCSLPVSVAAQIESSLGSTPAFAISPEGPFLLQPGSEGITLQVIFLPAKPGTESATLVFSDSVDPPLDVRLTGTFVESPQTETDDYVWGTGLAADGGCVLIGTPQLSLGPMIVTVDGSPLAQDVCEGQRDWSYLPTTNTVVFGPCSQPQSGDAVTVTYPLPIGCN